MKNSIKIGLMAITLVALMLSLLAFIPTTNLDAATPGTLPSITIPEGATEGSSNSGNNSGGTFPFPEPGPNAGTGTGNNLNGLEIGTTNPGTGPSDFVRISTAFGIVSLVAAAVGVTTNKKKK